MQLLQDTDAAALYSLAKVPTHKAKFRRQARLQLPGPHPAGKFKGPWRFLQHSAPRGVIYTAAACTFGPAEPVGCLKCAVRAPKSGVRCMTRTCRQARPVRSRGRAQPCPDPSWGAPATQRMRRPTPHRRGPPQSLTPRLTPCWIYTAMLMECNPWPSAQRAGAQIQSCFSQCCAAKQRTREPP